MEELIKEEEKEKEKALMWEKCDVVMVFSSFLLSFSSSFGLFFLFIMLLDEWAGRVWFAVFFLNKSALHNGQRIHCNMWSDWGPMGSFNYCESEWSLYHNSRAQ